MGSYIPRQIRRHACDCGGLQEMTIGKKLYLGFGLVLGLVAFVSLITWTVMAYDRSAKEKTAQLFDVQRATSDIGFQMMQNRQNLGNYLLSGDTRAADDMGKE